MKRKTGMVVLSICMFFSLCGLKNQDTQTDYSVEENWAYLPEESVTDTDVFFVTPTVYYGDETHFNMELSDEEQRERFIGAINMEKGIYEEACNFYAPYYRQLSLSGYKLDEDKRASYVELAYSDVKDSFQYYMDHYNEGRPIVLAGFSQGAEMVLRLMEDYFTEDEYQNQLVCAYVIGGAVTDEKLQECPWMKMAEGEGDTGCIVSFNSESENIQTSYVVPETTNGINPLNWKTDSTTADASMNLGACFTGKDGSIKEEIKEFCGAYLDEERGTLKIIGIEEEAYPPILDVFESGVYHIYDYEFFYRNLQENVSVRTGQYRLQVAGKSGCGEDFCPCFKRHVKK